MPNCFSASGRNFGNPYFAEVEFNLLKACTLSKLDFGSIDLENILSMYCVCVCVCRRVFKMSTGRSNLAGRMDVLQSIDYRDTVN